MPEYATEGYSKYARSSGPNAIKAALKKSKDTGHAFQAIGLNKVAELAYESESEDEKPIVRKTPTKNSFGDIMVQAGGGHDVVTQEKKKEDKAKKEEEHERPNARADTPQSGVPAGLPNVADLSRAQKALQDDNQYQPEDPHISRQPLGVKDTNQLGALLSMKKRNHQTNQSIVSMCKDHKDFIIYWDPDDLGNQNGSFIARIDEHEDKSPMAEHHHCNPVNVVRMVNEMSIKIIEEFEKQEDERLTGRDRRRKGKEPRQLPPVSLVSREVHNMYSQLFRTKNNALIKKKGALRSKLDVGERRKDLTEKMQLEAQRSRHRGSTAKDRNNDEPEGSDKPVPASESSPSKRNKKTHKQISDEKVTRNQERRGLSEIARVAAEPVNRFRPSAVEEQQAREARVREQVRRERAAETQNNSPVTKFSWKSKKFAVATDADEDNEIASTRPATKKTTRRRARRVPDSDDEPSEEEVVKKRKVATKPKSKRMSKADRALLKGITQAEQEESEQYAQAEAEAAQEAASEHEPVLNDEEKRAVFLAGIAAIQRAQLAAQKRKSTEGEEDATPKTSRKRKATPPSDDVEHSPPKKSRKERKSAAIVEDSDEEADFALPEASPALPHTEVRQEWTTKAEKLVEGVQQQQEEKVEQREAALEKGEEIVIDESITTVEDEKIDERTEVGEAEATAVQVEPLAEKTGHTATADEEPEMKRDSGRKVSSGHPVLEDASPSPPFEQAPKSPVSPAAQGSKRKSPFLDSGEEHPVSPSPPSSRPTKKTKQNNFSKEVVSIVKQDWKMDVPSAAGVEGVKDFEGSENGSSDDTLGKDVEMTDEEDGGSPVTEQTEEEDDGLDDLFEE